MPLPADWRACCGAVERLNRRYIFQSLARQRALLLERLTAVL